MLPFTFDLLDPVPVSVALLKLRLSTRTDEGLNLIIFTVKGSVAPLSPSVSHTGMRIGEICALNWGNVNLKEKFIVINKSMFYNTELRQWELGKPKGGISRTIDIGDTLVSVLKRARKEQYENKIFMGELYKNNFYERVTIDGMDHTRLIDSEAENTVPIDFVCTKKDGSPFTNQTAKCGVKMIKKETGIPFYFHMLRHTHATLLIENSAIMKDVQERLGHTDIRITMNTYAHVTPKMKKQTVSIFEKAIRDDIP